MQKIIYMQILPHELLPNNVSQVMLVSNWVILVYTQH